MIRTVLGDVDPSGLGVTMVHEHLLMTGGWPVIHEPDFRLDSTDKAAEEVGLFTGAGGRSLVEMTPIGFGRHPDGLAEVARRSGVSIVACTGFHKVSYYSDAHWIHRYDAEQIAGLLVADIEEGIDRNDLGGPLVDRSAARAGVIKVATEYQKLSGVVEKLFDAVALAHRRTGAPIGTHTEQGTMGHAQLDRLEAAGVDAGAVILGHIDHNPDPGLLGELAGRGAYLAFDMPGRIKYGPDSQTIDLVAALAEAGHGDRLLFAGDLARRSYWRSLGGGPGLDYLLATFVPRLEGAGLGEAARLALVDNPARALALRPAA